MGDKRPVRRLHPVGNVVALVDPGLVVVVVGRKLNSGELVHGAAGVPVAGGKFCGDRNVVVERLELSSAVVLPVRDADGSGADVAKARSPLLRTVCG